MAYALPMQQGCGGVDRVAFCCVHGFCIWHVSCGYRTQKPEETREWVYKAVNVAAPLDHMQPVTGERILLCPLPKATDR